MLGKVEPAPARHSVAILVGIVRTLLPVVEQLDAAGASEIGIETLEERLLAEVQAADAVAVVPPLVAARTRIGPEADSPAAGRAPAVAWPGRRRGLSRHGITSSAPTGRTRRRTECG
jgi:hypothetical protein